MKSTLDKDKLSSLSAIFEKMTEQELLEVIKIAMKYVYKLRYKKLKEE